MNNKRPSKEELHMHTAFLWAQRATCKQFNGKIGWVITDSEMRRILSIGYNGSPTTMPNDACRNIQGSCGCLHAEQNAIALVDGSLYEKVMFVTMEPCESCANLIAQANIYKVFYAEQYRVHDSLIMIIDCCVTVINMTDFLLKKESDR